MLGLGAAFMAFLLYDTLGWIVESSDPFYGYIEAGVFGVVLLALLVGLGFAIREVG